MTNVIFKRAIYDASGHIGLNYTELTTGSNIDGKLYFMADGIWLGNKSNIIRDADNIAVSSRKVTEMINSKIAASLALVLAGFVNGSPEEGASPFSHINSDLFTAAEKEAIEDDCTHFADLPHYATMKAGYMFKVTTAGTISLRHPVNNEYITVNVDAGDTIYFVTTLEKDSVAKRRYVKSANVQILLANVDVFGGATASASGTRGLVPAPAAGNQNKFLKGDGSWSDVSDQGFTSAVIGGNTILAGDSENQLRIEMSTGLSATYTLASHSVSIALDSATQTKLNGAVQGIKPTGGSNYTKDSNGIVTIPSASYLTAGVVKVESMGNLAGRPVVMDSSGVLTFDVVTTIDRTSDSVDVDYTAADESTPISALNFSIDAADGTHAGVMSSTDKTHLDDIYEDWDDSGTSITDLATDVDTLLNDVADLTERINAMCIWEGEE